MRPFLASLLTLTFALAACDDGAAQASAPSIDCALAGAADFAPDCTMERVEDGGRRILILRHPDGGFRRFELGVEGRGIITADGMEQADVIRTQAQVELRVGTDRYRLPVAE